MRSNAGVGFAIPSNLANLIMKDLISEGRVIRSWLGVFIQDVDDAISKNLKLPDRQGALVTDIVDGSPAEKAGLRKGMIIQEIERNAVNNIEIFKKIVNEMATAKGILLLVTTNGGSRYIFIQEE